MDIVRTDVKVVESPSSIRPTDAFLRFLGLAFTFVAAVLVGVSKETKTVPITISEGLPTLQLSFTAKWQYMSAFVYFLVSNAIACSYAAGSLAYSMAAGSLKPSAALVLSILDLTIMALLFSANGAAAAIGVIGVHGNSHVQWRKVCDMFGAYCQHMTAAIVLSLLGSVAFILLVVLAVLAFYKKSK